MKDQVVPRVTARMLIPFVLVFGFYVITHGEYGPGGGFQGGLILAVAVILHALVHGLEETQRALPRVWVDRLMAFGVLLYIGVGVVGFFTGHAFLDYSGLAEDPHGAEALGMTLVEIGVGITVAAVMVTLFDKFTTARG
jgi:multicomponent Na+:H+ antiporter subunit B